MKIIFPDIDGVLNCRNSKASCHGIMGIDDEKVKNLKYIIDKTRSEIVLTSSWRAGWQKVHKEQQEYMADYLDRKLKREKIFITDKTDDFIATRGEAITKWLEGKSVENYVILDDEVWDYEKCGLKERLVKTEFYDDDGGLNENKAKEAVVKLGYKDETGSYEKNNL